MCLLDTIAEKCLCIHPLYTDFDLFKTDLEATYEMQICNLVQQSKCMGYYLSCQISKYFEYQVKINYTHIDKLMIFPSRLERKMHQRNPLGI